MATLRLSFKGKTLQVFYLDDADTMIGRDPDCPIQIDSLAVAPRHARISCQAGRYCILALDPAYPLLLNNEPITEHPLSHGDMLQIGKHSLRFADEPEAIAPVAADAASLKGELHADATASAAPEQRHGYMQILNGENIGRIVPLKRGMIRFGHRGSACAVVARREGGFYLSHLEGEICPMVGGRSIGTQSHLLRDGDIVQIGPTRLQFHAEPGP